MKITKFEQSCLLVEMPEPINRTALFDPGTMSEAALDVSALEYLDDIIITHGHPDHYSAKLLQELVAKFPDVRITAPQQVIDELSEQGIAHASDEPSEGITIFDAPHEAVEPLFWQPDEIGIHYLDQLTHPGDSHSFHETKQILALPVTAPWGSTVTAVNLALKLKPKYVLPIHDWHWSQDAQNAMYDGIAAALEKEGITFIHLKTGKAEVINT
jgi:L-ascorbate metabolism protein UlaG (beta-lactamase superfamily)